MDDTGIRTQVPPRWTPAVTEHYRRTEEGGVLTITFTRDEKLNAVDLGMFEALEKAVQDLGDREDLHVLVLTGEGRYFTCGMDVRMLEVPNQESGVAIRRYYRRVHLLGDELEAVEKPVILAAQGHCMGLGVELGASCDFRFASERTTFLLPEIANIRMVPGSGGISRLTRLIGPHWTRWIAMAGQRVDSARALSIGLVHDVYPEEAFHERVQAFAHELASRSTEALALAKLAIDAAATSDRKTARDVDRMANTALMVAGEYQKAMDSFTERVKG
jgi:enoyl-CoA hydratase